MDNRCTVCMHHEAPRITDRFGNPSSPDISWPLVNSWRISLINLYLCEGLAAQKEIEMTLSQLQASSAAPWLACDICRRPRWTAQCVPHPALAKLDWSQDVLTRNTRIQQLESKLLVLENKTSEPKKARAWLRDGSGVGAWGSVDSIDRQWSWTCA